MDVIVAGRLVSSNYFELCEIIIIIIIIIIRLLMHSNHNELDYNDACKTIVSLLETEINQFFVSGSFIPFLFSF